MASLGTDPFEETEDQQALRKLARDVAERELAPKARHWDETEEFPQASWDAIRNADLFGITIQAPIEVAANVCDVAITLLAQRIDAGLPDCEADAATVITL